MFKKLARVIKNLRLYMQLFRGPVHAIYIYFSIIKTSLVALFNADFETALPGQLISTNTCLLMHSTLV